MLLCYFSASFILLINKMQCCYKPTLVRSMQMIRLGEIKNTQDIYISLYLEY